MTYLELEKQEFFAILRCKMKNQDKIRTISLFSGGGGLDIGFEQAGFDILFATDFNHECCETLKQNRGKTLSSQLEVHECDITSMDLSILPKNVDLIIGGPPCQSFSASGRRAGGAAGQLDKRGNLFLSYCAVVEHVQPKAFLFENVRGILATNKGQDFQNIVNAFSELGYTIDYRILDAEDYGVPQQRERMFIVGHKLTEDFLFPRPVFGPDSIDNKPYVSVKEAIHDLELTEEERRLTDISGGKYSDLWPLVPPGANYLHFTAKRGYPNPVFAYRSRFSDFLYKANPDTPVKTLIASPGKYTGPIHWDNRYLTVREYMRIQGFPDEHQFYGDRAAQIRQIGNSVCPKIAYYMALAIKDQIFGESSRISYLSKTDVLSFDKRKGVKAQKTKAMHDEVLSNAQKSEKSLFQLSSFKDHVEPSVLPGELNMQVKVIRNKNVRISVYSEKSDNLQARLLLKVFTDLTKKKSLKVEVYLYGEHERGVQTMWNAVNTWVKRSSGFTSLVELYGHFTEPHPIFEVEGFEIFSELPIFTFAKHCMDFANCSKYFPKSELLSMWGDTFKMESFVKLARLLRGYRFDVRCHETNIAIPQGVYMVAYPFALPFDKQMNFFVKESNNG